MNKFFRVRKIDNLMLPETRKRISLALVAQENHNEKIDLNTLSILNESHGTSFHHYWFYKVRVFTLENLG